MGFLNVMFGNSNFCGLLSLLIHTPYKKAEAHLDLLLVLFLPVRLIIHRFTHLHEQGAGSVRIGQYEPPQFLIDDGKERM
jgi:hypothetical protein